MEKEEILEKLKAYKKGDVYLYGYKSPYYSSGVDLKDKSFEGFISEPWLVGGASGGNCWGDEANHGVTAEDPNELTDLDKFLEEEMPEITFIQYKKILPLIQYQEYTVNEYYGNYNEYKVAYLSFEKLAEVLADINLDKTKKMKI